MNKINDDVLKDIFTTFPSINTIWFCGDLNTFYDTDIVIDKDDISGDVLAYIGFKYNTFELEIGLEVYTLEFMERNNISMSTYTKCDRGSYS